MVLGLGQLDKLAGWNTPPFRVQVPKYAPGALSVYSTYTHLAVADAIQLLSQSPTVVLDVVAILFTEEVHCPTGEGTQGHVRGTVG